MKYVLVSGGILSGLGKGLIASCTGVILKSLGYRVSSIKIDPYLNCDAGTMSPFEHGEVFVLDDGGEADLDLGNYERFLGTTLTSDNNITTGKIYRHVIEKERKGLYLGKTVQIVPHLCDEIQDWVERVSHVPVDADGVEPDICVIELGGTVGDIESGPFIEAMRQFQWRVGPENICYIHVSLVPVLGVVGEQKTKPTQQSVQILRSLGIVPDIIMCRSENPLSESSKQKIASFCHVPQDCVIGVHNVSNIYNIPFLLDSQGLGSALTKKLNLTSEFLVPCSSNTVVSTNETGNKRSFSGVPPSPGSSPSKHSFSNFQPVKQKVQSKLFHTWKSLSKKVDDIKASGDVVKIALVGKYTGLSDAYLSVIKALEHASFKVGRKLQISWIDSSSLQEASKDKEVVSNHDEFAHNPDQQTYEESWNLLKEADGILVPGGFGDRGVEGKMLAIEYARTKKIPYLGVCLGMQLVVVEFARNVLGWKDANSLEFNQDTANPVVIEMPEISKTHMGGTMRLGARTTLIKNKNTLAHRLYQKEKIQERHRHRYEVNPDLISSFESHGLHFTGIDESGCRMEIVELDEEEEHPFFVATQFHPEFLSRPMEPSIPFLGLLAASSGQLDAFFPKAN
eukprot:TRINITY_DN3459_c0_g1_i1.p1 TRINITY_DN3459_c0_g1~~TRINITY_DN3459_c0_g1_i1.p1  ORF type:complete len:624 (+),score=278.94 TRINITY_DN3459_c0_g1_i1:79-1950(+)